MSIIEFEHVEFSYGGEKALDGVTLHIEEGEFACVIGANGSGKSTLARHLNALARPSAGVVHVCGLDTRDEQATFDIRARVGLVFQNPDNQIVASLVGDDVAFGPKNLGLAGDELRERVAWALERVGLSGFEKRDVSTLSGGQKQRLAIAGALAMRPRVLVCDEATSMLDPATRAQVLELCRQLNADGLTIVWITHFIEEAALAHRVIALDKGRVALDGASHVVLARAGDLERLGIVTPEAEMTFLHELSSGLRRTDAQEHALSFRNVSFAYADANNVVSDFSWNVKRGSLVGIAGPTGSGKSTIAQLAAGLLRPTAGQVVVQGAVGLSLQYPERQLFAASVFDDVAFGPRNLGLPASEVERRVRQALSLVQLDYDDVRERSPFTLSGGHQRRVALAGVLALQPDTLIFDEPTAGLDPRARRAFYELVCDLRNRGITVVLVSHDTRALDALCDDVLLLRPAGE